MAICPDLDTLHSHVTLDWDTENEPHSTMYEVSKAKCIHWRVSASGKHKHILLCFTRSFTVFELFMLRAKLHDDPYRFSHDWQRWSVTGDVRFASGVLFDLKHGVYAGEWVVLERV